MAIIKSKLNLDNRVKLQDVIPLKEPFLIYIDPSSSCNFKCNFCPTGHKDLLKSGNYKRSIMDFDLFKNVIDQIAQFDSNLKTLRLNKIGEPTLNKHLPEMIKYAKKTKKINWIDFATNGYRLTNEFSKKIIESDVDRINISLEGISEEDYLKNAKIKIDFKEFIANLEYLFKEKKNTEILIKIPDNLVPTDDKKNYFLNTFGNICDLIFIEQLSPIWPNFDLEQRSGHKISNIGQYKMPKMNNDVCSVIFYSMTINSDGTVSACCSDWNQELIIGNTNENSLKEIWESEKLKILQKLHLLKKRNSHSTCATCNHPNTAQIDQIDNYAQKILKNLN